jgi:pimeloyl-ACP methyl ester carboxylesterase
MTSADAVGMPVAIGSPIAIRDTGTGTPVLLLHASASTGGQWNALVERLAPHHRVMVADLAGCGASGAWYTGEPALERDAAALADRIAHIDGPIHLVGHSFGGAIATRLALRDPSRVRSLTLIEPVLFHLLRDGRAAERRLHVEIQPLAAQMRAAKSADSSTAAMAAFIDFWNGEGAFAALKPSVREALAPLAPCVAANFAALEAERFPLSALRALAMPSLLLLGGASRPETQRIVSMLFDTLPDATLGIVGRAGHMLPVTHRDTVNARILDHIANVDGRGMPVAPATCRAA